MSYVNLAILPIHIELHVLYKIVIFNFLTMKSFCRTRIYLLFADLNSGVSMGIIKILVILIVTSCGMVIPTDKLINSSVNSSELSTVISNASDSFSASAAEGSLASGSGIFIQPGS